MFRERFKRVEGGLRVPEGLQVEDSGLRVWALGFSVYCEGFKV